MGHMVTLIGTTVVLYALLATSCCQNTTVAAPLKNTNKSDTNDVKYSVNSNTTTPISTDIIQIARNIHKKCRLSSSDPYVYNKIQEILAYKIKLLEYILEFPDYDVNPLNVNCTWTYRGHKWARAYSQHGQTLLSLAFNYGIMSLMTLTLGVENMVIPLEDHPHGCINSLTEDEKVMAVMYLLMRDFKADSTNITIEDQERICHEVIQKTGKVAKFTDRCCHVDPITKGLACTTDIINIWLRMLFVMLFCVKFGLLFFGPIWFIPAIESIAKDNIPYVIKLKDPLVKTIFLCNKDTKVNGKTYDKILDLRGKKGFPKLRESIRNIPMSEPIKVKFTRYDILVNYKRLLVENDVPVGVVSSFIDAFCRCKISQIGPFKECCQTDICKSIPSVEQEVTWLNFFNKLIKLLLVFIIPFPFYLRLAIFYMFEAHNINVRHELLDSMGLTEAYNGGILSYLTPTHPLFICVYVLYFFTAFLFGIAARGRRKETLKRTIIGSFRDLKHLSWIDALGVFVGNLIWPFKRFGWLGCLLAPFYWLVVLPLSVLMYAFYCLPSIYVAFRMMIYTGDPVKKNRTSTNMYRVEITRDESMHNFDTEALLERANPEADSMTTLNTIGRSTRTKRRINQSFFEHIICSSLCILTMFAVLLVMAECVGFVVELLVFTMMGVIVNAGAVLKYVTLLILVVVYSYDAYNNVGKKYLKLNKSLFTELKGRCKDIENVTSLPSHLQENYGFKSQELSEQGAYELPDDIYDRRRCHWMLNDLVIFVDNEDMPRIPKNLFEEICQITVAGAPGPVHQSLISATQEFLKIMVFIFFVFIVVLTFGQVYKVSSTNQMLATLAGGFLPFLMRTFLAPSKPDIELGTVSFKSRLDEIIKNFQQNWPIYDFPFELWTEEDEEKEREKEEEKDKDKEKGDKDKGDKDEDKKSEKSSVKDENENKKDDKYRYNSEPMKMDGVDGTDLKQALLQMKELHPSNGGIQLTQPASTSKSGSGLLDEEKFDVDILVYLPDAHRDRDKWLEEWSDLDELSDNESNLSFQDDKTGHSSNRSSIYKEQPNHKRKEHVV